MKYLVSSHHHKTVLKWANPEQLSEAKSKVQKAMEDGRIEAAYGLVGGGAVFVVHADDNAALARGLRRLGIEDVEVTPIVDVLDLLDGYLEYHKAQGATT